MLAAAADLGVPLMVVLAGGSMSHLATATIPEIIRRLAEADRGPLSSGGPVFSRSSPIRIHLLASGGN